MISYGGVSLEAYTPEIADWIERWISPQDVHEFQRAAWPGINQAFSTNLHPPLDHIPQTRIKINTLTWPSGASRWAIGHFLATDAQRLAIAQQAYAGSIWNPLPFVMSDGTTQIGTNLFMLPARPIAQGAPIRDGERQLYLMTLVDDRYRWWEHSGVINATSWSEMYAAVAAAIGISITVDSIHADYLVPPTDFTARYFYLPLLLDSIADSVGQKIVRNLDGTVSAHNFETSLAVVNSNVQGKRVKAGGSLIFAPAAFNDQNALVPESVTVSFPKQVTITKSMTDACDAITERTIDYFLPVNYAVIVQLSALAIPEYTGVNGRFGETHLISSTALAECADEVDEDCESTFDADALTEYQDCTPDNLTDLTLMATQIATDWYRWQLGWLDVAFPGVVNWTMEGLHHFVQWTHITGQNEFHSDWVLTTRVQRGPWNDQANQLTIQANSDGFAGPPVIIDNLLTLKQTIKSLSAQSVKVRTLQADTIEAATLSVLCPNCTGTGTFDVFEDQCDADGLNKYKHTYTWEYDCNGCVSITGPVTVKVGQINCCTNSIYVTAYEDRCESGDLNKWKLVSRFAYTNGCLELAAYSEVFVERIGYCATCDPIKIPTTTMACINSTLYRFTYLQVFNYVKNCLVPMGVEYVGGEIVLCNVDCCTDSGSGNPPCTPDECGEITWICELVTICTEDGTFCGSTYQWVPSGGWDAYFTSCSMGIAPVPLTSCDIGVEAVATPCCCFGFSYWKWDAGTSEWIAIGKMCINGGEASYPDVSGSVDGEVIYTCCCGDGNSGSGSGSGSGGGGGTCCGCDPYPDAFDLVIAGVPAGACGGSGDCDNINGTFRLNLVLFPTCTWESEGIAVCSLIEDSFWTLYCDGTDMICEFTGAGGTTLYKRSIANWIIDGCMANHTMDYDSDTGLFCTMPATITLNVVV